MLGYESIDTSLVKLNHFPLLEFNPILAGEGGANIFLQISSSCVVLDLNTKFVLPKLPLGCEKVCGGWWVGGVETNFSVKLCSS